MELKKYFKFTCVFTFFLINSEITNAQIVPDNSLLNNSVVNSEGEVQNITGGTQSGNNLFHSFVEFSIPTGVTAYFNNALGNENIFSRVTGNSISNINGIIRANSNANVFLINPQGIIFGPNATLDIGGSFLSSTADSIQFADGVQFSATNPFNSPLLTVNVPVGLGFGSQPAPIIVQGNGLDTIRPRINLLTLMGLDNITGLRVKPGKTLALIGGDLLIDGGFLTSEDGRIELGSVKSGFVNLNLTPSDNLVLSYNNYPNLSNIQLSKQAFVGVYGFSGGSIHIRGANATLRDGSSIFNYNLGSQSGGELNVNIFDSLEILGTSPDGRLRSSLFTRNIGTGNGSELTVSAKKVSISDGARIFTDTYHTGSGGNLSVNTSESIKIAGVAPSNPANFSDIATGTFGLGKGGNLSLSTQQLSVEDGAAIAAVSFAGGTGGNLIVNALEKIEVTGYIPSNPFIVSNISSLNFDIGEAGQLNLSTRELIIQNGGGTGSRTFGIGRGGEVVINSELIKLNGVVPNLFSPSVLDASTFGPGDAGSLTINTTKLVVQDGARVDTTTLASGKAGNLTINALDSIEVSGKVTGSMNPSLIDSSANILDESLQQIYQLPPLPSGASGDLIINTGKLNITNGGIVSVRNDGSDNAGTLRVNADSIFLDNESSITAATASGQGGEISLQTQNLQLRNNSAITTNAGGSGNGGNITIGTSTLTALENSDITANALKGQGGNIQINAQGLFLSPDSEIRASSEAGPQFDGVVQVNTPDIDFTRATVQPVGGPESPEIASVCQGRSGAAINKLTNTGTGGVPATPTAPLSSTSGWQDGSPTQVANNSREAKRSTTDKPMQIVEAQGWKRNANGTVSMTAEVLETVQYSSLATLLCSTSQSAVNVESSRQ